MTDQNEFPTIPLAELLVISGPGPRRKVRKSKGDWYIERENEFEPISPRMQSPTDLVSWAASKGIDLLDGTYRFINRPPRARMGIEYDPADYIPS